MSNNIMITYDLHDASPEMHETAMELLVDAGFTKTLPGGNGGTVHLPQTTVVGSTTWTGTQIRDWVWSQFDAAKVKPKRVAVLKHGEEPAAKG
jgi:hypothetical protein